MHQDVSDPALYCFYLQFFWYSSPAHIAGSCSGPQTLQPCHYSFTILRNFSLKSYGPSKAFCSSNEPSAYTGKPSFHSSSLPSRWDPNILLRTFLIILVCSFVAENEQIDLFVSLFSHVNFHSNIRSLQLLGRGALCYIALSPFTTLLTPTQPSQLDFYRNEFECLHLTLNACHVCSECVAIWCCKSYVECK